MSGTIEGLTVIREDFLEEADLGLGGTCIEEGRCARSGGLHVQKQGGWKGRGQGETSLLCFEAHIGYCVCVCVWMGNPGTVLGSPGSLSNTGSHPCQLIQVTYSSLSPEVAPHLVTCDLWSQQGAGTWWESRHVEPGGTRLSLL